MKNRSIAAIVCALLLLGGCSRQPAPPPTAQPESTTPPPVPSATAVPEEDYEYYHVDEVGATLLLPKSWRGNYVVEAVVGTDKFAFAQKDYLSGEMGMREDGTQGPIPDPDGRHVPLAYFRAVQAADFAEDPSGFSDTGPTDAGFVWLGERNGTHYILSFPTSFSAGDPENAARKQEQYNALCSAIEAYPKDASAYFVFDEAPAALSIDGWTKEIVSDKPGNTQIRYYTVDEAGTEQTMLEVNDMAEEHDLDGDGAKEIVVYVSSQGRGLGIYDVISGELTYLDVSEALGCTGAEYTGNIGNIQSTYENCIEAFFTGPDGTQRIEVYRYSEGGLEYLCPLADALLQT